MKAKAKAKKAELRAAKSGAEARMALHDGAKALRDLADSLATGLMTQAREAGLDERAEEFAHRAEELGRRVRDSDRAQHTMAQARKLSGDGMDRLGGWLSTGRRAELLGVRPARRGWTPWLMAGLGMAAGYVVGVMTAPKRGEELRQGVTTGIQRMKQDTADHSAPPAQKPIADEVRTRLGEDPRTSDLPKLNINVAEGTVFVRGSIPQAADEQAIREVVSSIPGVADVDLQVTVAS